MRSSTHASRQSRLKMREEGLSGSRSWMWLRRSETMSREEPQVDPSGVVPVDQHVVREPRRLQVGSRELLQGGLEAALSEAA